MNRKLFDLLCYIVQSNAEMRYKDLALHFCVTERTIRNYVNSIQTYLSARGNADLINTGKSTITFTGTRQEGNDLLFGIIERGFYEYKLSAEERKFIILADFLIQDNVTLDELENDLYTSKITILNDIKDIQADSTLSGLKFNDRSKGYHLVLSEVERRANIIRLITSLKYPNKTVFMGEVLDIRIWYIRNILSIPLNQKRIASAFSIVENHYEMELADDTFYEVCIMLCIIVNRIVSQHVIKSDDQGESLAPFVNKLWDILFNDSKQNTGDALAFQQYIYAIGINPGAKEISNDDQNFDFYIITKSFLYKLAPYFNVNILKDAELQEFLSAHISMMYKRIVNQEVLTNPYKEELLKQYEGEFSILRSSAPFLEKSLHIHISDDELSYVLMHIMAASERLEAQKILPRVIIICQAGFSTSHFLAERVKNAFRVTIVDISSERRIRSSLSNSTSNLFSICDFIITTIPLYGMPVPWIKVDPSLTEADITNIHKMIDMVTPNLPLKPKASLPDPVYTPSEKIRLDNLIIEQNILLDKDAHDWKEAIILSAEPLLWERKITANYMIAMVNAVIENGPYIVFAPHVALAHAREDEGALEFGVSILRLNNPICFGNQDNDPVKYVIAVSTADAKKNIKVIEKLMNLFCNDEKYAAMSDAEDKASFLNIIINDS